jgi:hypothetical protein
LYLYLLSQNTCRGYDTYSSAVVAAHSEEEARQIHPAGDRVWRRPVTSHRDHDVGRTWCFVVGGCAGCQSWPAPEEVKVRRIGVVEDPQIMDGDVLCKSFRAG